MKKEKMYISGKMKGQPDFRTRFNEIEKLYESQYKVINPCRIEHSSDDWEERILTDLNILKHCDIIYMLDNWKDSNGAQVEHYFAQGMGKKIIYQSQYLPDPRNV